MFNLIRRIQTRLTSFILDRLLFFINKISSGNMEPVLDLNIEQALGLNVEQDPDEDIEQHQEEDEDNDSGTITVRVTLVETNDYWVYRLKPTTRLFRLKNSFAKHTGWPGNSIRFYYGPYEILHLDTPTSLRIRDDGDIIARLNRVAMSDMEWIKQKCPVENIQTVGMADLCALSESVVLHVVCGEIAKKMDVRIGTTALLLLLKNEFYKLARTPNKSFLFKYKDYVIDDSDTPAELNMTTNDKIEVSLVVVEGAVKSSSKVTMIIVHDDGIEGALLYSMNSSFLMMDLKMNFSKTIEKPVENLCFLYRGQVIDDDVSPYDLGMREFNVIYVMDAGIGARQVLFATPPNGCIPRLWLIGNSPSGNAFTYSSHGGLNDLKLHFSNVSGWPLSELCLWYKGKVVKDTDTIKSLQMEYDDVVKVTRISYLEKFRLIFKQTR